MTANANIINRYNVVILAAGASTRLGSPKQLLTFKDDTLLRHAINEAEKTDAEKILVVLGSGADEIEKKIADRNVHVVKNVNWNEGIGSSIRAGMEESERISPGISGIILMVCDQPFVTSSLLKQLIDEQHMTGKPVVACEYHDTLGTPVLFHKDYFEDLTRLSGDSGAKRIVLQNIDQVHSISFPLGEIDIDNKKDYESLMQKNEEV